MREPMSSTVSLGRPCWRSHAIRFLVRLVDHERVFRQPHRARRRRERVCERAAEQYDIGGCGGGRTNALMHERGFRPEFGHAADHRDAPRRHAFARKRLKRCERTTGRRVVRIVNDRRAARDHDALVAPDRQLERRCSLRDGGGIDARRPRRGKSRGKVAAVVIARHVDVQRQRAHIVAVDREYVIDAHDRRSRAARRPLCVDAEPHRLLAKFRGAFARGIIR